MTDPQDKSTREQIELRAYQIYLERGAQDGQELADWLAAEQELTAMAEPRPAVKAAKRDAAAA